MPKWICEAAINPESWVRSILRKDFIFLGKHRVQQQSLGFDGGDIHG